MGLKDIIEDFERSRTKCYVNDPEADRYIAAKQAVALEDIASHLYNIEEILDLIRQNAG